MFKKKTRFYKYVYWSIVSLVLANIFLSIIIYEDYRKSIEKDIESRIKINVEEFKSRIFAIMKKNSGLSDSISDVSYLVDKGVLDSYAIVNSDSSGRVSILELGEGFDLDEVYLSDYLKGVKTVIEKNGYIKMIGKIESELLFDRPEGDYSFQGIIFVKNIKTEELNSETLGMISVNFFNVKIFSDIRLDIKIGLDKVVADNLYEITFFNFATLIYLLMVVYFDNKVSKKTEKTIKSYILTTSDQISKLSAAIRESTLRKTDLAPKSLEMYGYCNYDSVSRLLSPIIESISILRNEIWLNFISYKQSKIDDLKTELTNEKQKFRSDFEIAFKNNIPDINKVIQIENYKIDIATKITPLDIASGDGVYFNHRDNKIMFGVFDVSGHGISSSFKAVTVQSIFKNYFRYAVNKIDLKELAQFLLENSFQACKDTVEIIIGEFDISKQQLSVILFGNQFTLFFDDNKKVKHIEFSKRLKKFQHFETQEELDEQLDKVRVMVPDIIDLKNIYRMIITTDGYYESMDKNDEMVGYERLIKIFTEDIGVKTSKDFMDVFLKKFKKISSEFNDDDKTLVVVTLDRTGEE